MERFYQDFMQRLGDMYDDLETAVSGLPQEALDWVPGADMNSLCVLVVHVVGAARYWVGDVCVGDVSNRDRDAEFAAKGHSDQALKAILKDSLRYSRGVVENLSISDLAQMCPAPGRPITPGSNELRQFSLGWSLLHALEHTSVHVGHAQITRQLWDQRYTG